jgi:hypothetical protein
MLFLFPRAQVARRSSRSGPGAGSDSSSSSSADDSDADDASSSSSSFGVPDGSSLEKPSAQVRSGGVGGKPFVALVVLRCFRIAWFCAAGV